MRRLQYREWAPARFFLRLIPEERATKSMSALQSEIEERLTDSEPAVEVLLAELLPNGTLRVFIDHPDGVTLALCERVTMLLSDLRERYSLEVSSPGAERPLDQAHPFPPLCRSPRPREDA